MKFILATKEGMTQKFAEDGTVIPVTKLLAKTCVVTQVKNEEKDGYLAVQVGCGAKKNISKSVKGHLKELGSFRYLKEFRIDGSQAANLKVGDKINVGIFQNGDMVQVSGISKGKGFQGVVRRHGFHGSPASHGHKDQLRMPGSIGATGPAHVFKGTKMAGQMGNKQVTVKNLQVVEVDQKKEEIFIKGAVPGHNGNLILIYGPGDFEIKAEVQAKDQNQEADKSADQDSAVNEPEVNPVKEPKVEEKESDSAKAASDKEEAPKEEKAEIKSASTEVMADKEEVK